ncbi:hypothetical protein F1D05_38325 [Kribbella qitaiheensis]|uniref:Uncharacterized protein n=1 Tax=Kribbella qitaiheensis TaxID=1544730 RepID=A0A7G6X8X3_9ACTN|nr:hypothetical protein [Kribbella qitaiheensis]QNE22688.1 hypothetical protein F1D05_38325 [Kribbella qitaiheensis]
MPPPVVGAYDRPWADEDLQLALWCCYELHYRGFDDVDKAAQWDLDILAFRAEVERPWLDWLCATYLPANATGQVSRVLRELVDHDDGPALAAYLRRHAKRGRDSLAQSGAVSTVCSG